MNCRGYIFFFSLFMFTLFIQVDSNYDEVIGKDDYQEPIFSEESKKHFYDTKITTEFLMDVQIRFATGCTIIWRNSNETKEELNLAHVLVKNFLITSVIQVDYLFEMKNIIGCRTRPMFVIFQSSILRRYLTKFTYDQPITGPVWIMFLHHHHDNQALDNFFNNIYPRFDSEFLIVKSLENKQFELSEIYKVRSSTPLIKSPFAIWNQINGFTGYNSKLGMNQRRNNLHNVTLKALTTNNPPISKYVKYVWELIQEQINCRVNSTDVSNTINNYTGEENKWDKMISYLGQREAHLIIEGLVLRNLRYNLMDFTMPLLASRSCVFIHGSRVLTNWRAYFTPFQLWLWVTIIFLIIIVTTILVTLIWLNKVHHLPPETNKIESWADSFIYVFGIFCQQGLDLMKQTPCRLVIVSAHFTGVVLCAAYSSTVISLLAVQMEDKPFSNMDGLIADGSYPILVLDQSPEFELFRHANESTAEGKIFKKFLLKKMIPQPDTISEGLELLCNKNKTKYAFMAPIHSVKAEETRNTCRFTTSFCRHQVSFAYALAKNSPYRRIINHMLTQFRNVGILERVRETLLANGVKKVPVSEYSSVSFESVLPLLSILAFGSILSLLAFIIEKLRENYQNKNKNNNRNHIVLNKNYNIIFKNEINKNHIH